MNERRSGLLLGVVAVVLCLLTAGQSSLLYGQYGRASITGIVRDASGAVVPSVSVTVVNTQTQVKSQTTTNESGNYVIELPIGQYSVTFSAPGFKELTRSDMTLASGQIARVDVALEVGQVTEKLNVTAETPMLQTETAHTSAGVDANIFAALPLNFGGPGATWWSLPRSFCPGSAALTGPSRWRARLGDRRTSSSTVRAT